MACNVPTCDREAHSRGVCSSHYNKWSYDRRKGKDEPRFDAYIEDTDGRTTAGSRTTDHPLYSVWQGMKTRCYNPKQPNYKWYGARGVSVCDRWQDSFHAFVDDIGERPTPHHTLDRIDVGGDYAPSNVRWASPSEQARNRRNNRLDTDAVKQIRKEISVGRPQKEIAEEYRVTQGTISAIKNGRIWGKNDIERRPEGVAARS